MQFRVGEAEFPFSYIKLPILDLKQKFEKLSAVCNANTGKITSFQKLFYFIVDKTLNQIHI